MAQSAKSGKKRRRRAKAIDPITFSVILNRFNTICDEMSRTIEKTAWTSILALSRDFSCAIYDSQARQVCMMDALPIHTNSMQVVIREMVRAFEGDVHDGDVIVCNDPYSGNTHVGDFVTATPVFHNGKHIFWSITKGHQLDCGAFVPTSVPATAKDVWQEGLQLPPIKFYDRGEPCEDVISMYLANMRWQELLKGDLMAQLGSIWTGKRRLIELAAHYGNDEVERYIEAIFDYSDKRMAAEIRAMPDGDYHGQAWLDSDGQGGTDIPIHAKVSIRDDHVHVDFAGTHRQGPGANNCTIGVMQAAAATPILCVVDPTIPANDGCLRHITCEAPEGSLCNAQHPTSTATATICPGDTLQFAVWKALAHAVPERTMGGMCAIHCVPMFSGTDRRDEQGNEWGSMLFNAAPGGGAGPKADGWPLLLTPAAMGGQKIISVELSELLYPFHFHRQEICTDSMGHGVHIGGPGIHLEVSPIGDGMECNLFGDGQTNPPYGAIGGTAGMGGGSYKENLATGKRIYYSAKGHLTVDENEIWICDSTGGGGFGDPLKRDPEMVLESVLNGLVSIKSAKNFYGVAIDSRTMTVDSAKTKKLRRKIRATRAPVEVTTPNHPSASNWLKRHMRRGDEYLIDPQ